MSHPPVRSWLLSGLLLFALPAFPESTHVYASNYDLLFSVDGQVRQVRSRARVRNGHTIPVSLGNYQVDITVSERAGDEFEIDLEIFEESQGTWYRISPEILSFDGSTGIPVQFSWSSGGIELDIALVVSIVRH